jgi:hypothetical protein
VIDCCLTPNDQNEDLDISKNSGKPYKNTNFDKEDILTNHKSSLINEENCESNALTILRYQVLGLFCSACIYSICLYKTHMHQRLPHEDILTNHKSSLINEENCELSTLYWIPKFQKNQYLNGYIFLLVQQKNYL